MKGIATGDATFETTVTGAVSRVGPLRLRRLTEVSVYVTASAAGGVVRGAKTGGSDAEKADAERRIAFARLSSRFSCSSWRIRAASAVVVPGASPRRCRR